MVLPVYLPACWIQYLMMYILSSKPATDDTLHKRDNDNDDDDVTVAVVVDECVYVCWRRWQWSLCGCAYNRKRERRAFGNK